MTDEQILSLWRSLPSDYKQFDELVLEFGHRLRRQLNTELHYARMANERQAKIADEWRKRAVQAEQALLERNKVTKNE